MPFCHLLIHGASGIGASICFKLNSSYKVSSSIFGIMFGGFINGIEKDNFVFIAYLFVPRCNCMLPNKLQSLFFIGNGSKNTSFFSL